MKIYPTLLYGKIVEQSGPEVCSVFVGFVTELRSPPNVCAWSVDRRCVHKQSSLPSSPCSALLSGGFRNSERGVQSLARDARWQIFGLPRPLSVALEVRTEYLEATLGLVKCLEISKELIRECVTMPGCSLVPTPLSEKSKRGVGTRLAWLLLLHATPA